MSDTKAENVELEHEHKDSVNSLEKYSGADAEVVPVDETEKHDVWGELDGEGPNYRGLGWMRTVVLLCKCQIGLGVLAMPSNLMVLGMGPGLFVIFLFGLFSTWSGYIVGKFKMSHPDVYSVADVGRIMVGPRFGEMVGAFQWIYLTFVGGAQMLASATAFNALSTHGACTVVFVFVSAAVATIVGSFQTLGRIGWITWVGMTTLMVAIITVTIAVGVQDRPGLAPKEGPWSPGVVAVGSGSFIEVAATFASISFTYSGPPNFVPIVAEMRDNRLYTRSLLTCQGIVITTFLVVASLMYHFCGVYVASPALGSAGPLLKKICYGLALPGLLVGAVLFVHLPAKYLFVRLLGKTRHLVHPTKTHYLVWYSCVFLNGALSFLVAEAIPVFDDLLSLIGAALATPLAMTLQGAMFVFEARRLRQPRTPLNLMFHAFNVIMILMSLYVFGAGWYASVMQIRKNVTGGSTTKPFSCADNSNSV